jgi:RTX calcium-binding nonapeptide repeat (4 copies)
MINLTHAPRTFIATVGVVLAAIAAVIAIPATASAEVTCTTDGGTLLEVVATDGSSARIVRDGANIEVPNAVNPECASGPATITGTANVHVVDQSDDGVSTSTRIELTGGRFAPGAGNEPGDSDEIEFQLEAVERLRIEGTTGVDEVRLGTAGVNLNAGQEVPLVADADVTFTGLEDAQVSASDGADIVRANGSSAFDSPFELPVSLAGGQGDDELTGGPDDDFIGDDLGEPGDDELAGGAGDDILDLGLGDDEADGGSGTDEAIYFSAPSPVTVDLSSSAQQNTAGGGIDALVGLEDLVGSAAFGDTLRGTAGANALTGLGGGDVIDPRGGQDEVGGDDEPLFAGEPGNDRLLVRDGVADTVSCHGGADSVTADKKGVDTIAADCENVAFPAVAKPPTGQPPAAPSSDFSFGNVKRNKRRGTAKLTVGLPAAGDVELATTRKVKGAASRAEAAGELKLRVKPKGRARRKLAASGKAKVAAEVTFTPDGGSPSTRTKALKLRRVN